MGHSQESVERLQALIDRSAKNAGDFLRSTFKIPENTLTARQVVRYMAEPTSAAFATVAKSGEPRVAPVDLLCHEATFYIPTHVGTARVRHVSQRPPMSLTHWVYDHVAIIVHGTAGALSSDHPDCAALDDFYQPSWWRRLRDQGEGVYLKVDAERVFAWGREMSRFPE